ncbi:hypothetical protein BCR36DRAFT_403078 [Piromyces finnis]|uniref:Coth-domain-containing protein n=1 Tax=Piromyces finnis TaxID=1754191 RepID=A0A1Y1VGH1_9FUNG|nr:hypothetical protein BCR36DRAFT_403078 [Piromyces finnis]|eukprot:ORX55515.1 hypothetical protein BCR36DRAFT_403078 [Piromyces finnis]
MIKITILFTLFISIVFADLTDYLKSTKRTFNEIEGKVPRITVELSPLEYESLVNITQIEQVKDIIIGCNGDASCLEDFETKVKLTYELNGEKKIFKKVTFKTGGKYSRAHDKVGFNLKLNGDDLLFDRKQIRLRADPNDYTHMRSKIAYDLLNIWNIPSEQENYCELYINDEYFGLYFIKDTVKSNWIKKTYNLPADKEIETLYYCNSKAKLNIGDQCLNQNDKTSNYTEPFEELLERIQVSESIEDIEKFMNVDLLMKNFAIEFLFGSHDHFIISGHNYFMYQREDSIWDMILVDFDSEFGSGIGTYFKYVLHKDVENYGYKLSMEDMRHMKNIENRIFDITYSKDKTAFKKALREIMITGFNPDALFKRIEELKAFIAPYVKKATTPRPDGRLPGVINLAGDDTTHTYEDFDVVSVIENNDETVPSLKSWIQNRFEFACEEYGFDKKEILKEAAKFRGEKLDESEQETSSSEEEVEVSSSEETDDSSNEETDNEIKKSNNGQCSKSLEKELL